MKLITIVLLTVLAALLAGCGLSTFTQRELDPYIRDVFFNQTENVSITVTDASRRLVYEFKNTPHGHVICADASPDTSIAAAGSVGGELSITNAQATGAMKGQRSSAATITPLLRRSQGLQWGRDNAALECMLYAMHLTDRATYLRRLDLIREEAKQIINKEIDKGLGDLQVGQRVESQWPVSAGSLPQPPMPSAGAMPQLPGEPPAMAAPQFYQPTSPSLQPSMPSGNTQPAHE